MAIREASPAPVVAARPRLRDHAIRGVAWALVTTCVVLLGTILVAGERTASYAELRAAVADGRVDVIRVEGGLDGQVEGDASAVVHWRDGLMGRVTSVTEATSRRDARAVGMPLPILLGRVDDNLTKLDPDLRATRSSDRGSYNELGPWRVPGWTGVATVVMYLGVLGLLVGAPSRGAPRGGRGSGCSGRCRSSGPWHSCCSADRRRCCRRRVRSAG